MNDCLQKLDSITEKGVELFEPMSMVDFTEFQANYVLGTTSEEGAIWGTGQDEKYLVEMWWRGWVFQTVATHVITLQSFHPDKNGVLDKWFDGFSGHLVKEDPSFGSGRFG